ncbi:response regulator [Fangia hongkongensis]|uniref:response regulator n=1 Tax=Fangia hongkongensis TaxID=270495 RepID=UPI0003736A7C|nr:response regulator [Fangia hongkongensis]MBK2123923.1 response regulator [Fangia hongkongensis]
MNAFQDDFCIFPLDNIKGITYLLDRKGRIVDCNQVLVDVLRAKKNSILSKRFSDLDPGSGKLIDERHDYMLGLTIKLPDLFQPVRSGDCYAKVMDVLQYNDQKIVIEVEKRVIRDIEGNIIGLLSTSFDDYCINGKNVVNFELLRKSIEEHKSILDSFMIRLKFLIEKISDPVDKLETHKVLDQITKEALLSCPQIDNFVEIAKDKKQCYEKKQRAGYKMLFIHDNDKASNFYDMAVRSECFHIYWSKIGEFDINLILQSRVVEGFFYFLVIDLHDAHDMSKLYEIMKNIKGVCFKVIVHHQAQPSNMSQKIKFDNDEKVCHINDGLIRADNGAENIITLLFELWNRYRMDIAHQKINEKGVFRVLIVEDYEDSRKALSQYIKTLFDEKYAHTNLHFEIAVASNGCESLNYALNFEFDLIILDIGLPDWTGYEVASIIRDLEQKYAAHPSHIIVNTGHSFVLLHCDIQPHKYGFDKVYLKPNLIRFIEGILKEFICATEVGQL